MWNFTPQFGVGFQYFLKPRRSITFNANAVHISNASLGDDNPGVNATVQFQIGNAGRNILRQRSFFNWDFSSLKNFQIQERIRLQFRFEAFHFTNTPRFGQAGGVLGTATFGRITSADIPRNLQFGMKLIW